MNTQGCQGPECRDGILHKSDCAIHNGDALPVGPCDCGAAPSAQDSAAPSSVSAEQIDAIISKVMNGCFREYGHDDVRAIVREALTPPAPAAAPQAPACDICGYPTKGEKRHAHCSNVD